MKNPRPLPPRPVESHGSPNIDKEDRDLVGPGEREYVDLIQFTFVFLLCLSFALTLKLKAN